MASEEAKYDIIKSTDVYEIRKYADRLAVEVVSTTGDNSFRKLFNYISGKNEKNQEYHPIEYVFLLFSFLFFSSIVVLICFAVG